MTPWYVGLDAHGKWTQFVILDQRGRIVARGELPTTVSGLSLLVTQHRVPKGTRVALESGTMAKFVVKALERLGLEPVVVDAYEVRQKAYRPRQKSDRRDAFEICDGLRRDQYRCIVHMPSEEIQGLRETLALRRHFVRVQSAEMNAAKHLLRSAALCQLSRSLQCESGWLKLESRIEDRRLRGEVELHHRLWRTAGEQIATLEKSLAKQSRFFEADFRRLQTVPGVGPIVSLTAIAAFSDPRRFGSAKQAASYAGLVPSTRQSGDQDRHGRITKQGSAELRSMLCEAAHHAARKGNPLSPYFRSLCARRGYKMAIVAVAHRLCRILYAMLRDHTGFDLAKVGVEMGPFEKKIVQPYRLKPRTA